MSAFLCNASDLAALARAYVKLVDHEQETEAVYADFLATNLASLAARYGPAAGVISDHCGNPDSYGWPVPDGPDVAQPFSALDEYARSYNYQSCEHDGWAASVASDRICALRAVLAPLAAAEVEEAARAVSARRRALAQYPSLGPKETAATLRRILKATFPACKFSIVTERGSMVSSVRIEWMDGPTVARVKKISGSFEAGHFDGMTDSYDYDSDSLIDIDGTKYRPGTRYVSENRRISPALAARCIAQVVAYFGNVTDIPVITASDYDGTYKLGDGKGNDDWKPIRPDLSDDCGGHRYSWSACIRRAAEDATEFTHAEG